MNNIKSVEELMKSRYLVIADYPENQFPIDLILTRYDVINFGDWLCVPENTLIGIKESCAQKYPHLFRKLEWWEIRDFEQLPKYVKYENKISKVIGLDNQWQPYEYDGKGLFHLDNQYILKGFCWREVLPATESEYTAYLTKLLKHE